MRLYDYAASCNCLKVRILLAHLGVEYERVPIDIFRGETLTGDYGRKNPARTTPVLETDSGRYLPESAAILMYLADGTRFLPGDPFLRAEVVRWLVYEQTELVPAIGGLRFRLLTARLHEGDADTGARRRAGNVVLQSLNDHLDGREFFVGDGYSAADIALFGYLHVAGDAGYDLASYPRVAGWLDRVRRRPGYVNDLVPYPPQARVGQGHSLYGPLTPRGRPGE